MHRLFIITDFLAVMTQFLPTNESSIDKKPPSSAIIWLPKEIVELEIINEPPLIHFIVQLDSTIDLKLIINPGYNSRNRRIRKKFPADLNLRETNRKIADIRSIFGAELFY